MAVSAYQTIRQGYPGFLIYCEIEQARSRLDWIRNYCFHLYEESSN